ncbi:MAG: cell wall hydrolase [Peptococcaceae bacterium]|nr:cell wall hydrolase [Peptococcaceae bacterium]
MRTHWGLVLILTLLIFVWCPLPASAEPEPIYYTVKKGDTLYDIAQTYNLSVGALKSANRLTDHIIYPGQILTIPTQAIFSRGYISRDDLLLLAKIIHAEARGESFAGQVAVGAVILNRLASPYFPSSLRDVIFEKTNNVYQFSPVGDGTINLPPDEKAIKAAMNALMGHDPTGGALFFYNPTIARDRWIRSLPVVTRIGNHVFATMF